MKEEVVIYLGKSYEKKEDILVFCKEKEIDAHMLDDNDLQSEVISLFSKSNPTTKPSQFAFDFILFKNNNRDVITTFYQESKSIITFTHKAILTQHNQSWLLHDLLEEMQEEHLFFKDWELLHTLLKEANDAPHETFTLESYEPYKQAFIEGYLYTKQPTNKEDIKRIIENIQTTQSQLIKKEEA